MQIILYLVLVLISVFVIVGEISILLNQLLKVTRK